MAMCLAGLGVKVNGQTSDPGTLNAWLKSNGGFSGDLFVWGSVTKLGFGYGG